MTSRSLIPETSASANSAIPAGEIYLTITLVKKQDLFYNPIGPVEQILHFRRLNTWNIKLDLFKNFLRGKKIAVLGIGISNRPLIRYIAGLGGSITAFDKLESDDPVLSQTRESFAAEGINLEWCVGPDYLSGLKGFDLIFRTPKMRWDLPELRAERDRGAIITSEMEVFMELCPATMFGITGSDGKTTTTTLISLILKQAGYNVYLGGNIGTPLLDRIDSIRPEDMVVLELSSFQLMSMRKSPDIAVVTNITPNHLDVHKDYQEYIDAKRNILLYQPFYGRLVLNGGNYETRSLSTEARGEVVWFGQNDQSLATGCFVVDGQMVWRGKSGEVPIVKTAANQNSRQTQCRKLPGSRSSGLALC